MDRGLTFCSASKGVAFGLIDAGSSQSAWFWFDQCLIVVVSVIFPGRCWIVVVSVILVRLLLACSSQRGYRPVDDRLLYSAFFKLMIACSCQSWFGSKLSVLARRWRHRFESVGVGLSLASWV